MLMPRSLIGNLRPSRNARVIQTAVIRYLCGCLAGAATLAATSADVRAQQPPDIITPLDMSVGRSIPISLIGAVSKVSIANPDIADIVVVSTGELVVNARAPGETDAIVWQESGARHHYRVLVTSSSQRKQVLVGIKFAEVDRTMLADLGSSGLYQDANNRVGTGALAAGVPTTSGSTGSSTAGQIAIPASD